MPYVPQAIPAPADPILNWDGKNYGYGGMSSTFSNHDPTGATTYMTHPSYIPPPISANMSTGAGSAALLANVDTTNDPIAKAVMENLLGILPTKKPKITVSCSVCKLELSSQTVLDSHLTGSKHQRKVKSANLLKSLEESEKGLDRDEQSGVIRCTVCDVTVNSPQLLATHIAGNKHKQRAIKHQAQQEGSGGSYGGPPPAKKPCHNPAGDSASTTTPELINNNNNSNNEDKSKCEIEVPDCVTKLEETKGGRKYLCNPCQAHCNSELMLSQHLVSRRHLEKMGGGKSSGHGGGGGWRGGRRRPSFKPGPRQGRGQPRGVSNFTQPLSHSFVAATGHAATGHAL